MSDGSEILKKAESSGKGLPPAEFVEKIGRAMMSQVPVLGALITEFIPTSAQNRVTAFCMRVTEDIQQMSDDLQSRVLTDEFASLFMKCLRSVTIEFREEKLNAYRAILSSSLYKPTSSDLEARYVDKLDSLTAVHLQVLRAIWVDGREKWQSYTMDSQDAVLAGRELHELLPGFSVAELFALEQDLEVHGLIWKPTALTGFSQLQDLSYDVLDVALSDFGIGFLTFITPDHPPPDWIKSRLPRGGR